MRGDFSRFTFRTRRHFTRVLKQQGRVELDADWNEYAAIQAYLRETGLTDLIGQSGTPAPGSGFRITPYDSGRDFTIAAGRMYVDGILVENDADTRFTTQPGIALDAINPPAVGAGADALLRTDLLYLDVWEQHLTALEDSVVRNAPADPDIREVALGGPDTATRLRTVWRARLREGVVSADCDAPIADFPPTATGTGRLTNTVTAVPNAADPCIVEPDGGGYRGLENRLYRVEIHTGSDAGAPTFKWSSDNGAVLYKVDEVLDNRRVRLTRPGRDQYLRLQTGNVVEMVSAEDDLRGRPGFLTTVTTPNDLDITLADVIPAYYQGRADVFLRRWDSAALPVAAGGDLGDSGISVTFSAAGTYRTGDYWTFAARVRSGDVEPVVDAPPHGNAHHYTRLALVQWWRRNSRALVRAKTSGSGYSPDLATGWSVSDDGLTWTFAIDRGINEDTLVTGLRAASASITSFSAANRAGDSIRVILTAPNPNLLVQVAAIPLIADRPQVVPMLDDCRLIFPPLTRLVNLLYVSGDGQETLPGTATPQPLVVRVNNGGIPVSGALVEFRVSIGNGSLRSGAATGTTVIVPTDADGFASCIWTLDNATYSQQVTANLQGEPPLQVRFNGTISRANLFYVGGDGQEAFPGTAVPQPLVVRVSNAGLPVSGAAVEFRVSIGNGRVNNGATVNNVLVLATNPNGFASVGWTLDATTYSQQVTATLQASPQQQVLFDAVINRAELFYVGGDGQEAVPGVELRLPQPLEVRVENSGLPVSGADVVFHVEPGNGTLRSGGGVSDTITVQTDGDGLAACAWILDGGNYSQRATATLAGNKHQIVHFDATLSRATEVAYTPSGDCTRLDGVTTVAEALDRLCLTEGGEEPGIHVKGVFWQAPDVRPNLVLLDIFDLTLEAGAPVLTVKPEFADRINLNEASRQLIAVPEATADMPYLANIAAEGNRLVLGSTRRGVQRLTTELAGVQVPPAVAAAVVRVPAFNDRLVDLTLFSGGLVVDCDQPIAHDSVSRATCYLTLEIPQSVLPGGNSFGFFGYEPIVLRAASEFPQARDNDIFWQPSPETIKLLQFAIQEARRLDDHGGQVLIRLMLKGNFVRHVERDNLYLDGEAFGAKDGAVLHNLRLPSGNGRRGGDFEMWFWLGKEGDLPPRLDEIGFILNEALLGRNLAANAAAALNASLRRSELQDSGVLPQGYEVQPDTFDQTLALRQARLLLRGRQIPQPALVAIAESLQEAGFKIVDHWNNIFGQLGGNFESMAIPDAVFMDRLKAGAAAGENFTVAICTRPVAETLAQEIQEYIIDTFTVI